MTAGAEAALRDAGRWVSGVASELGRAPWPVPAAVALGGLVVLLLGARARRPIAVVGAAGVAVVAARWLGPRALPASGMSPVALSVASAAVCGAVAAVVPPFFPALAGAIPGALLGSLLAPEGLQVQVVAAGVAVGALVGVLAARPVAAATAAGAGALAVALGATGALHGMPAGRALSAHPAAILASAVVLGVAGTAFQLSRAWGRGGQGAPGKRPGKPPAPVRDAEEKA